MLIARKHDFRLYKEDDFYKVVTPNGKSMVNASGTKKEVTAELKRWKDEVDYNNRFMLEVENYFIKILEKI
jgi:hypothetical protein